ncbi:T9SS type A sorting domain-containing protein [Hymenobacter cellulosivorans]|uniref:T9SS type A sorting domain-containing protein n=1 Tax=Hymenobacter cellulosivorans TaxID=2932249 RepID=A0ABY4FD73_9BACT|nr:T9SS type A sorting domain-containing protein [Hymenobacter cellulosivorans]UOQ53973.1 T9SS type A sorting domain-containing protein [Hymenobacter cellulosivorans]
MLFSTPWQLAKAGLLSTILLAALTAQAQTAPTWTMAKRLTSGGPDPTRNGAAVDGLRTDASGNVFTVGDFHGTLDLGGTTFSTMPSVAGDYDSYLAKYNATGTLLWAKHLNGAYHETVGTALAVDAAGNTYLTGSFYGSITIEGTTLTDPTYTAGGYQLNGYVAKFAPAGNLLWIKRIGSTTSSQGNAAGQAITMDGAGNVVLTASFSGSVTLGTTTLNSTENPAFSYPSQDLLLAKLDPQGTVLWARNDGGTGSEWPQDITVDGADNIYLGGSIQGNAAFGTIRLTASDMNSDGALVKFSPAGTPQWAVKLPATVTSLGRNIVRHVSTDLAGNVSLVGEVEEDLPSGDMYRAVVARYTTQGTLAWSHLSTPSEANYNVSIVVDGAGNSYVGYPFMTSVNWAGVSLTASAPNIVNCAIFSLTPQGTPRWSLRNDSGDIGPNALSLDQNGLLYVGGAANGPVQLGNLQLAANSANYEPFFARLSNVTLATKPAQSLAALALYPNPAKNAATVSLPARSEAGTVVVRDLTGRLVQQVSFAAAATQVPLPLKTVSAGLYTVQVVTEAGFSPLARLVVQ